MNYNAGMRRHLVIAALALVAGACGDKKKSGAGTGTGTGTGVGTGVGTGSAVSSGSALGTAAMVSGGVGVLALAGGVIANVQREMRVGFYNSPSCIANGDTRMRNCGYFLSDASTAEALAITGYAVGGVLIVLAVVLYVTAPNESAPAAHTAARRTTHFGCSPGPGDVGLACGGVF